MENPVKKVLITSNGDEISRGIAFHLAKRGCRLVLMGDEICMRSIKDSVMGSIDGVEPLEVVGVNMQEETEGAFEAAVDTAWRVLGNLDAFVNCHTYEGAMQDCLFVPVHEFRKIMKINFMAPWFLLNAVGRRMKNQISGGSIIFITPINGAQRGLHPGAAAYSSCWAGVHQLVRASAMDLGKYKIRVNAIARGLHLNDTYAKSVEDDRARKLVKEAAPLGRWLDVTQDLFSTVLYLISDGSRYITGTTIFVDGGQSLSRPRMRSFM